MGRPSEYQESFAAQAEFLTRFGAIDEDLAQFFGKSVSTISKWKVDFPEFSEALKKGKAEADREIAQSLFDRAKGARYIVQKEVKVKEEWYDKDGKRCMKEKVEVVSLHMQDPPDTTACIFWLKNRRPDLWRDKQEHKHSGDEEGAPILFTLAGGKT